MANRLLGLALVAGMALGALGVVAIARPVAAGDGSVRFLSAGPVRLGDGHTARMELLVPAVKETTEVHFLGDDGALLKTLEIQPPARQTGPFFEVSFDATFEMTPSRTGAGTMSITDGTSNTIVFSGESHGIIAVLIGLRQGLGTLQLVDAAGATLGILPYIEQDNLFRR
jgi:hypothetical protein